MHVLGEAGVSTNALESYFFRDVLRHHFKLVDLRTKLSLAYSDLLTRRSNDATGDEEEDIDFDKAQDEFVMGALTEDIGIDLLGLKDLGVGVTCVPLSIWNKKAERPLKKRIRVRVELYVFRTNSSPNVELSIHNSQFHSQNKAEAPTSVSHPALHFRPIDPTRQIGLLRDYYALKHASGDMLEDGQKPLSKAARQRRNNLIKLATKKIRGRPPRVK